jgi:K+-transporting ATPase ATPase C chain
MGKQLWAASRALLVLTLLLGVAYPLSITAVARLLPAQANGSIVTIDGVPVGSALFGQATTDPQWFQARPSASKHSGQTSGGTNWGPAAAELAADLAAREAELRAANPQAPAGPIPADALTSSGSGLDPHISPAYAAWQAPRVAAARGLSVAQVHRLIDANTTTGELGFLGADRVNVTTLNAALATSPR